MIHLLRFTLLFLLCLLFVVWAAEDETFQEKAERLFINHMADESRKRAKNPPLKRCAKWSGNHKF